MSNAKGDSIAPRLVPPTEPHADKLNHLYSEIIKHLMGFFNRQGPRLGASHKLDVNVVRGIFIAAYQQVLSAIVGIQFHMQPHQQQEMSAEILDVITKYSKRAELFLPTNLVVPSKEIQNERN